MTQIWSNFKLMSLHRLTCFMYITNLNLCNNTYCLPLIWFQFYSRTKITRFQFYSQFESQTKITRPRAGPCTADRPAAAVAARAAAFATPSLSSLPILVNITPRPRPAPPRHAPMIVLPEPKHFSTWQISCNDNDNYIIIKIEVYYIYEDTSVVVSHEMVFK